MKSGSKKINIVLHAMISSIMATMFLFILHHLPIYQIFIDPFSEAIKNHDIMDVAFSKFRNHNDPALFDEDVFIINSQITDKVALAKTLEILDAKQAKSIGIDLLLSHEELSVDTVLRSFLDNPNVVLGYTFEDNKEHVSSNIIKSDPFFKAKRKEAYVNLGSNDGFSIRNFEPFHEIEGAKDEAFSVKLVRLIDPTKVEALSQRKISKEWINFRRKQPGEINKNYPINSEAVTHYAQVNMIDFIQDSASYDDDYFKDKVVLIGFCGENDKALSMKDRYFTPLNEKYSGRSMPDMHGVVVHANIISMILDGDFINEINEGWLYLLAFFIYFINFLIFNWLVKKKLFFTVATSRLIQIAQFIVLFTISIYLITQLNIKVGFVLIITAVVLSFELFEFYHHRFQHLFDKWFGK